MCLLETVRNVKWHQPRLISGEHETGPRPAIKYDTISCCTRLHAYLREQSHRDALIQRGWDGVVRRGVSL